MAAKIKKNTPQKGAIYFEIHSSKKLFILNIENMGTNANQEYKEVFERICVDMREYKTGRLMVDVTFLENLSYEIIMEANTHIRTLLDKIPYLVLAVVQGKSNWGNMSFQIDFNLSDLHLKKIKGIKIFDSRKLAIEWLLNIYERTIT